MKKFPDDLKVHVVSHSHWDREWRQPFEFFQPYLVKCMDQLLEIMEKDPRYRAFLLDGQAVMAEDYLDARPEKEEKLRDLIKEGRIFTGPWYSLIDNNLIDPESIVRNLLYGTRMAKEYGGCMKEGYLISSFGHCGQIPQIFAGFGISSVLFSRGISEWQTRSELTWESPDGTNALGLHLPDRYTKSNWFYLVHRPGCVGRDAMDWKYRWPKDGPVHACDAESSNHYWWRTQEEFLTDKDNWVKCVEHLIEKALSVSTIPILLAMDGVDHLFPHDAVPDIIEAANEHFGKEVVVHSTLPDYIDDVRNYLENEGIELETKKGEMRRPMKVPGFNQLLSGTISARMRMKLMNHEAETSLIRLCEPLCAMASLYGREYPRPFIDKAWKLLMVNHAHDGICGTSVDAVHDAMADRYRRARDTADFLAYEAMKDLVVKIDTSKLGEKELALTVFNTCGFQRSRTVKAVVDIPYEWDAAGIEICDLEGNPVPFKLISKQKQEREILADHEAQLGFLCLRIEAEFFAEDLPAFGYKTYMVRPGKWLNDFVPEFVGKEDPAIITCNDSMENEYLKVWAEIDGGISLLDKENGEVYTDLNVFASSGDIGDSTLFMPPMHDFNVLSTASPGRIEIVERGPLKASLRITKKIELPAYCEPKRKFVELVETAQPFKAHRSEETVEETIITTLSLEPGSRRLDIKTVVENRARDHRLRVLFPTGAMEAETWVAGAPFDSVERSITLPDTRDWAEPWPETQPVRGWFVAGDGTRGLAVFSKGIPEGSCLDDEERTLALTLLRCTRRSIGENYELEGAQCLGRFEFEYAVQPFSGKWTKHGFPAASKDFETPVRALLSASGRKGELPAASEFLSLEIDPEEMSGNIVASGIKKAEEGSGMIVRIYNPSPESILVKIYTGNLPSEIKLLQLDETEKDGQPENGEFTLEPFKIKTVLVDIL